MLHAVRRGGEGTWDCFMFLAIGKSSLISGSEERDKQGVRLSTEQLETAQGIGRNKTKMGLRIVDVPRPPALSFHGSVARYKLGAQGRQPVAVASWHLR